LKQLQEAKKANKNLVAVNGTMMTVARALAFKTIRT